MACTCAIVITPRAGIAQSSQLRSRAFHRAKADPFADGPLHLVNMVRQAFGRGSSDLSKDRSKPDVIATRTRIEDLRVHR